jgi:hypothetical protein
VHRITTITLAFATMLAISGVATQTTAAKTLKQNLILYTNQGGVETAIAIDSFINVVLDHSEAGAAWTIEAPYGTVTCTGTEEAHSGFSGSMYANNEPLDRISLQNEEPFGELRGGPGCSNSSSVEWFTEVHALPLGSLYFYEAKRRVELKAGRGSNPTSLYINLMSGPYHCYYTASKLKGALNITPSGRIAITFANSTLRVVEPSSYRECGRKAKLSASFSLQAAGSDGFGEGQPIYGKLQ